MSRNKYLLLVLLVLSLSVAAYFSQQRPEQRGKAAGGFQPSAPYYATFYYPWYENSTVDGTWSDWNNHGHKPPQNWFSQYLPDPNPAVFDPATELYSSNDDGIIYWQLRKLAEAKEEVAISSWWGQGHRTDTAFKHIITDVMNRTDNPYPNLRWALYYEKEGSGNPTVAELVSDLNYIKTNYAGQPGYLKIGGKPVIFVNNAAHAGSDPLEDLSRWKQARSETGFYVVMKADPLSKGARALDMDGWYEYAPAEAHYRARSPYYSFVSPGFWLNGAAERLTRDAAAFETAVKSMVASDATWKLTETWNEWGEGTGVEPADEVTQTVSGKAKIKVDGYPFKNLYVDILNRNLPPLERGTGAATTTGGSPVQPPATGSDPVIVAAGDIACDGTGKVTQTTCQYKATSDLVLSLNPNAVLMLGDDQYQSGKLSDYRAYYDPTWGRFKNITYPVLGNHQYGVNSAQGYFDYWNGAGNQAGQAGKRGEGWYSFDLGAWHILALDGNCGKAPTNDGAGRIIPDSNNCNAGSAQEQWLKTDLEANKNKQCIMAFWHEPYWTSGSRKSAQEGNGAQTLPLIQDLYDYHADVVLTGHQHWYERFAKQDPNGDADPARGLREIIVGTGGKETHNVGSGPAFKNREVRDTSSFGVLKMTLHTGSYDWQFAPVPGYPFTDSGTATCNAK